MSADNLILDAAQVRLNTFSKHPKFALELDHVFDMLAEGVESNQGTIQQEVVRTQAEVSRTQAGIRSLIENARSEGGSVLRPSQE